MAGESLLAGFPNVFRALYYALTPASTPVPKKKTSPTLTPERRKQAVAETARRVVAQQRSAPSALPAWMRDTSLALTGSANDALFGLPAWAAAKLSGTPNDLMQAYADEAGRAAPTTNVLGTLGMGLATGNAEAKAIGEGGRLVGTVAPRLGRLIEGATELKKGQKLANTTKIIGAGAAAGATDAAIRGRDVGQGAEIGAVAAPVVHLASTGGGAAFRKARDLLGYAPVSEILTKYIKTPIADIQAAMDARAKQGLPSSVYEVLPQADRESLQDAVKKMPAGVREQLNGALSQRAQQIVGETASRVKQLTRPAVNPVRTELASDLAASRGATEATIPEKRLAVKAVQDTTDMNTLMRTEAKNIMAPHDEKFAYESVDDLTPKHLDLKNGTVQEVESNPEITSAIRDASGKLKYRTRQEGISIGDVTGILSNLAKDATSTDTVKARNAREAAEAVMDALDRDHPDVSADVARMRNLWRTRIETIDAMREGYRGRTRQEAGMKGMDAQDVRSAYDTPQGQQGRALGQATKLGNKLLTTPTKALGEMNRIESDPTAQVAISQNLGGTAGEDIANIARMQSESIRNLGGVNPNQSNEHDVEQTLQNLVMAALPQTMTHTKAIAVSRLFKAMRIPEKQGSQIVDMLFSTDPKNIARGVGILRQAGEPGEQILRSIAQDLAVGVTAANTYQNAVAPNEEPIETSSTPDYSKMSDEDLLKEIGQQPQDYSKMSDEDLLKAIGQQPSTPAPEPQPSPYAGRVESTYTPEFQQLFDRVLHQESGHAQTDANGNPVQSPVGAVGIAQVMPTTAPKAAKLAGVPWDEYAYYTDPEYNKTLGAAYLNSMLDMFNGDPALAVAAYNAGPGRVKQAIAKGQSKWFDYLPDETKQYLQAVLQ